MVVSGLVPAGWLGVLSGAPVLMSGAAVVSAGVIKGSAEEAVSAGAVGEEALPVPMGVLPSSVVTAGPWWVLVPIAVSTQVGERRVEVGRGSMLVWTPNKVVTRAELVPTDMLMVVSALVGVMAMGIGVGVPVVSTIPVGVPVVSPSLVGVGSGCTVVPGSEPRVLWAVLPLSSGVGTLEAVVLPPWGVAVLVEKESVSTSGVEVSGLEGGMVPAVVEVLVGSSAVVPVGIEEVG